MSIPPPPREYSDSKDQTKSVSTARISDSGVFIQYEEIRCPFSNYPPSPEKMLVLDTESTEDDLLTVFGFYNWGSTHVTQYYFPTPISPASWAQTDKFKTLIVDSKIAIYNAKWECRLFPAIPVASVMELCPSPYLQRSQFFQLASLDEVSSKHLPPWTKENYSTILYHNYSCLIHAILITMGSNTYARLDLKKQLKADIEKYII